MHMPSRPVLAALLLLCFAGGPALGQSGDDTAELKRQVEELKAIIQAQNARLEALEKKNSTPLTPATPATAPATATAEARPLPKGASAVDTYWKNGFHLRTTDDKFDVQIGAIEIFHSRFFTSDSRNTSTFLNKETRLFLSGKAWQDWEFKLEGDFVSEPELMDGWVAFSHFKEAQLKIGQFKQPFSMEELPSDTLVKFTERSLINRMVPGRDLGVQLFGSVFEGKLNYWVGAFNGNGRQNSGGTDNNDDKDVVARLQVQPFKDDECVWIKGLYIGGAGTWGNTEGAFGDLSAVDSATVWLDAHPSAANAGTTRREGERSRYNAELAWLVGPFGLRAEWMMEEDMLERSGGAGASAGAPIESTIDMSGFYVQGTYWLTGEDEQFSSRPQVKHVFAPWSDDGGWGAVELALRYSTIEVDSDIFDTNLASRAVSTSGVDQWAGGINWWFNPNVRFTTDYFHNHFRDTILTDGDRDADESLIMTRMQIDF